MALVTFTLKDFQLESLAHLDADVVFQASEPATSFGYLLSTVRVVVPLAPNGSGVVDLVPTTTMPQKGVHYTIQIRMRDPDGNFTYIDFPDWKLFVPSAGGNLDELMQFPTNPSFVWVGESPPAGSPAGTLWFNPTTNDLSIWS